MPRAPITPGQPATAVLKVRLTPADLDRLDQARGTRSRSDFVRDATRKEVVTILGLDQPRPVSTAPVHRHRRGKQIADRVVRGQPVKVYACTQAGCTKELTS